jgi:methylthioribose-1-phosphate isomerase
MRVDGIPMRTIWPIGGRTVGIIDQTKLPYELAMIELSSLDEIAHAIKSMLVRGAPLIGATAAYGVAIAISADPSDTSLLRSIEVLGQTRPTAKNLRWALERCNREIGQLVSPRREEAAWRLAALICEEDVAINRAIGLYGLELIRAIRKPDRPVNILTHCNAGWLATVDFGTALSPVYAAHDSGVSVHVWVDETRPRNQGASLTAWELAKHGVPHTVIVDNVGGHLMQHGMVDMCIVGTDRTTAGGDVANKIGTYLKALAAHDNNVPFYVALPSPSIDWNLADGIAEIPIEQRDETEVTRITGRTSEGTSATVCLTPPGSPAANYAFDVTPARLVTALITERGICPASRDGLRSLFPERA